MNLCVPFWIIVVRKREGSFKANLVKADSWALDIHTLVTSPIVSIRLHTPWNYETANHGVNLVIEETARFQETHLIPQQISQQADPFSYATMANPSGLVTYCQITCMYLHFKYWKFAAKTVVHV